MRFWRVYQPHRSQPLDGVGAERYGGRWNPVGLAAVYGASSRSLAMLEVLAHLEAGQRSHQFAMVEFEVDARKLPSFQVSNLPKGWDQHPAGTPSQHFGKMQFNRRFLGFRVPSLVVPQEQNVVIFPRHADFSRIRVIRSQEPFLFDPRLFKP